MRRYKRLWRRAARVSLIGIAAVVALALLALAFLHTSWGKGVVRRQLESQLGAMINGTVRVGSVDYSMLGGSIHLGDLQLYDASGRPAVRIEAIDVELDRWSLLSRAPVLERLAVRGLGVSVVQSADGRTNLTGLFKAPPGGGAPLARFRISRFVVDGAARVTTPAGTAIALSDLAAEGSLDARSITQELDLAIAKVAADIAVSRPDRSETRVSIRARIDGSLDQLGFDGVLRAGEARIAITGSGDFAAPTPTYRVRLVSEGTPDVASNIRVDLTGSGVVPGDIDAKLQFAVQALAMELSGEAALARDGAVHAVASLRGAPREALAALAAAGVALPDAMSRLQHQLPPRLDLAVTAAGRLGRELAVEVSSGKLGFASGTLELGARAVLDNQRLRSTVARLTFSALDLATLLRLGGRPAPIRGSVSGEVVLRGPSAASPVEWRIALDVARGSMRRLAPLLPPELRDRVPRGDIAIHAEVSGTPARPRGRITLAAEDGDRRADLVGTLATTASHASLSTTTRLSLAGRPLAVVAAAVTAPLRLGRIASIEALRRGARLDATLELASCSLARLADLEPRLAALGAQLGGAIEGRLTATGPVSAPRFDGAVRWSGYRTAAGTIGHSELFATGTAGVFDAKLVHGDRLRVTAHVERTAPDRVVVTARARADETPVAALLPAVLAPRLGPIAPGDVRAELAGRFAVGFARARATLEDVEVTGSLALTGAAVPIPRSDRRYRVDLTATAGARGVELAATAHERDLQNPDRRIEAKGSLSFADHRPARLDLGVVGRDWLVSGGAFGSAAAPGATLDFDLGLVLDLAGPVPRIDATVHSLSLEAPDRVGELLLQPPLSTGDIIVRRRGDIAGRLPVAARASAVAAPTRLRPMIIDIHVPEPIRLDQGVLALMPRGDVSVRVHEDRTEIRGGLVMDRGAMKFFGKPFALSSGSLQFSDAHPAGWMALTFERALPDAAVRGLSKAGPTRARLSLEGPLTAPALSFSGATNIEFTDVVAVNNIGRARYVTRPGLAVSQSAQVPRGEPLLMTAFLAMLAPQLLFLDHIAAWSDPADGRYGQIQHVEATRYLAHDRASIRGVRRPPALGRSTNELHVDRLLIHSDRAAAGIGLRVGDRGGGGIGAFLEWSSRD